MQRAISIFNIAVYFYFNKNLLDVCQLHSYSAVLRRVWLPGLHSSILLRARPVIIIMPDSTRMQITFSVSHYTLEVS